MKGVIVALLCVIVSCCYGNPTNVTEIIESYGYPCENYYVTTPDGYILNLQRIPHGIHNAGQKPKAVVMFQHGLVDNAVGICLNPPKESLPFILADAGYEVWLGNNRGNGYSMSNTNYTIDQPQFWNFTWDQMAQYDFPTQIEYVKKISGVEKIAYIGHSEGTTQAFAGFIEKPSLSASVGIYIALAPVAYVYNQRSKLLEAMAYVDAIDILYLLGQQEFHLTLAVHRMLPAVCREFPSLCVDGLDLLMGPSVNTNTSRISYYLSFEPNPTSVLNVIHWSQGVTENKFQKYDYGAAGNKIAYGQSTPPQYDLSTFPKDLHYAFFHGGNDYLADPADVEHLLKQLPTKPVCDLLLPTYSHTDFLWAEDAYEKVYSKILVLLEKYM